MNTDVAIIGGGIGGLMAAYRITKNRPDISVVIYDSGHMIEKRRCPASKNNGCVHCKICSITCGFAGAGAFSDGKFNLGTAYGGTLGESLGDDVAMEYINEVDNTLRSFAGDNYPKLFMSNEGLRLKCIQHNLRLLDMNVRHLGTDKNLATMERLIDWISEHGVRLCSAIYEPKILYRTKTFEDRTRMFCFNQGGLVSAENNHGIITANGHAYAEPEKKTDNCNFAILSSINFTKPFNKPTEYAEYIARMANMIGSGNVLVQRFGDLVRGRRTNDHRLGQNTVIPTLKATAGDLSLVLPHRMLTNIIETIYALDKVAPGTANDDTLLYGCENKYYSIRPQSDENFMLTDGVYLIGDGSGITRGLSQAGAMGLFVADKICK